MKEVLHSRNVSGDIKKLVKGVMIESYLVEGSQKIGCENHVYGNRLRILAWAGRIRESCCIRLRSLLG